MPRIRIEESYANDSRWLLMTQTLIRGSQSVANGCQRVMEKNVIVTSPLADIIDASRQVCSPLALCRVRSVLAIWGAQSRYTSFLDARWEAANASLPKPRKQTPN